jgi:RNA polymerase sigma-70 factor (ECF subfamily)
VVLSVLQGYTTREIAETLGMPHGTVSSKLYRALKKLRNSLESQ